MRQKKIIATLLAGFIGLVVIGVIVLPKPISITFEHILLSDWIEQNMFDPVVLLPEPKDTPLRMGPLYSQQANYVEMSYINMGGAGMSAQTHNIFQSDSFTPFFNSSGLLKMYDIERQDVTTKQQTLTLDNQDIVVEIRRNEQLPNRGVTLFVLGNTSVAHEWQGATEDEALMLLAQSVQLVTINDMGLIEEFDRRLQARLN